MQGFLEKLGRLGKEFTKNENSIEFDFNKSFSKSLKNLLTYFENEMAENKKYFF